MSDSNQNSPTTLEGEAVITSAQSMVGKWHKITTDKCDAAYPDNIEFLDTGVYLSTTADQRFALWQSGDYELVGSTQVSIQSATDEMITYEFTISDKGMLIFVDKHGCELKYRRAA